MKKKITLFMFLLIMLGTMSTLMYGTVTKTVAATGADFTTLAAAVTWLNGQTIDDNFVIDVTPGHTESVTAPIILTATGTSSFSITIQKATAGANPIITRTDSGSSSTSTFGGQGDAVFIIQGTDYLTIDGINLATQNQSIEYGYYFRKASTTNGNKFDTIKNCTITMTKGTSQYVVGIYGSNNDTASLVSSATGVTITSTGGRNESLAFYGNTIQNVHAGIALRGYNHSSSPYDLNDQNMMVGQAGAGNIIQNFAGGSANTTYGVYMIYQTSPNVSYNTIANASGGGSNATSTLYGIFFSTSSSGGAMVFDNNAITLNQGSTSIANAIHIAPNGTSVSVSNNVLNYGAFASTTASYAITCSNTTPNMTITGNYNSSPITKTGAGAFYPYYDNGSPSGGTATIANNNFSNITLTGSSTFIGIQHTTTNTQMVNAYGNTVSNITGGTGTISGINVTYGAIGSSVYNNTVTNITNGNTLYGMNVASTSTVGMVIYNNTVNSLTGTGASVVCGIYTAGAATGGTTNIYQHEVYDIFANNAGGSAWGIYISGGSGTTNVHNNLIYNIRALGSTSSSSAPTIGGIRISGGTTNNVHYNSCLLNYDGANAYFASAGLYINGGTTNEIRNNIFVNKCTPGASGRSVAVWKTASGTTNFGYNSNKNIYWTGDSPDATHPIGYFSSTAYPTLAEYKSALMDRDQASYSENVMFLSESAPYDLHINSDVPTRVEGNGVVVAGCAIDFDNQDRNASTPDIGADEGDFTAVVAAPGTPVYSSPLDTATGVSVNAPLAWSANSEGGTPTSYEVYFGQSDPPDYLETIAVTTSTPAREFGKSYYWKVKAINEQGDAEGSVWSFTVATGVPVLTYPGDTTTGISANPTFTWGAVAGATYKIKCGTSSGATDVLDMVACATNSYPVITPLPYSTPLYWSVYSVNGAQEIQSAEWSFTTMANPNNYSYPYTMDFEEITTAGSLPQYWSKTGSKWTSMTTTSTYYRAPRGGTDYLTCAYSSTTTDWLFSRGMYLDASKTYDLGMWYNTDGLAGWTSFKMYIGTLASGTAMTTELASVSGPTNTTYTQMSRTAWQPPASGVYYVGFQVIATSGPWYMCFDDFSIAETPTNPMFAINPTSKAFGLKGVFTQTDQLFTISNAGQGTLTISAIEREGDGCFSLIGLPELPIELTPSSPSTTFTVRYNPTVAGDFTGNIKITDDLSEKALRNVALTASAFDPILPIPYTQDFSAGTTLPTNWTQSTSAWSIASSHGRTNNAIHKNVFTAGTVGWFQTQPIGPITGSTRLSFYYRLVNYSGYPTGSAYTPGVDDKIKVWVSTDEGLNFVQYDEINSTNHATSLTWAEKQVWLSGSKANNNDRIVLKFEATWGSGDWYIDIDDIIVEHVSATPVFSITPASKAFGDTQINSSSASQDFTIKNAGGGTLTISEISLAGVNADQFILTNGNAIPKDLGAGQSIVVSVVSHPTSIGAKTASLKVVDNIAKATNYASLTGTGVDMTIYNLPYLQTLSEAPQAQYWQQVTIGSGVTDRWSVSATNLAGGLSPEWKCAYASGNPATTRLISPAISVAGLSTLVVKYRQTIDDYSAGCTYKLRYGYSNNSFTDIWTQASAANTTYPSEEKVFTLSSELAGHNLIYICWEIEGNFVGFDNWYIDNIKFLPTNTEINQIVASGATAAVIVPPITVGAGQVSPEVGFAGLSGDPIINVWATYQPVGSHSSTGMVLNITGGDFSGVTMTITHNLGFVPQWIKYQIGSGELFTVMNDMTWTTTTATVTIGGGGKGPLDISMSFPKDGDEPLAVNLSSFTAVLTADMYVKIAWIAETETGHAGYNVLRATENNLNNAVYINANIISSGTSHGSQISYSYTDADTEISTQYYYWLESVSLEGVSEFFGPLTVTSGGTTGPETPVIPLYTALLNAFPNPFNPSTNLRYSMKEAGDVQIDIYNTKGQLVRKMNANHATPGFYSMTWDGRDASGRNVGSGVYMYQMTSGQYKAAKKMILAK
ncbi:MAG: hypothetical protein CVU50_02690 [Candidatus Cloacimonetes bacterium HGW-Cloacimonetes-3]|jgi:hypothetical protein|nr:MAG: hypothetical protein CVU50_02690 [Candidatus Cloacimonetes bacterium HGW-Cloacimonetes-3]